ncbi:MAG: carboxypeptidase-like regulatory domain-containing protein [Planctomycetota bacterium]
MRYLALLLAIAAGAALGVWWRAEPEPEVTSDPPTDERLVAVEGVVKSAQGDPVAGARIIAQIRTNAMDLGVPRAILAEAVSGPDGGFWLAGGPRLQDAEVLAHAPGHAWGRGEVFEALAGHKPLEVRLDSDPCRVTGRVVDASGRGLGNVRVDLSAGHIALLDLVRTKPDGSFEFVGVPYGPVVLGACSAELAPSFAEADADPKESKPVKLFLTAGATLYGELRDAETGQPLAGARLHVSAWPEREVTTDKDGRYEYRGFPPIEANSGAIVVARARGHVEVQHAVFSLSIRAGRRYRLDLFARAGSQPEYFIVDENGRPIAGALAALAGRGGVTTDDRGRVLFDHVDRNEAVLLTVSRPGHLDTYAEVQAAGRPGIRPLGKLELPSRPTAFAALKGRVAGAKPGIPARIVYEQPVQGGRAMGGGALTDETGAFELEVPIGRAIEVQARAGNQGRSRWQTVTVTEAGLTLEHALHVRPLGLPLRRKSPTTHSVKFDGSKPYTLLKQELDGTSGWEDVGYFAHDPKISLDPSDSGWRLVAVGYGFVSKPAAVAGDDVALSGEGPQKDVKIRVLGADGAPRAGLKVRIVRRDGAERAYAQTQTGADGRATIEKFPDLPGWPLGIEILKGRQPLGLFAFAAAESEQVYRIVPGARPTILVRTKDGRAIAGARVSVFDLAGRPTNPERTELNAGAPNITRVGYEGLTDHKGRVIWSRLPGGSFTASVEHPDFSPARKTLTFDKPGEVEIEFRLDPISPLR